MLLPQLIIHYIWKYKKHFVNQKYISLMLENQFLFFLTQLCYQKYDRAEQFRLLVLFLNKLCSYATFHINSHILNEKKNTHKIVRSKLWEEIKKQKMKITHKILKMEKNSFSRKMEMRIIHEQVISIYIFASIFLKYENLSNEQKRKTKFELQI